MRHASLSSSYRRSPKGEAEDEQHDLLQPRLAELILPQMFDRWIWSFDASGEFSENRERHNEAEHVDVGSQSDVTPNRRSARIPQAPERCGFHVTVEEHELVDHGEPANCRGALSDCKSNN
ncbi:hypothetical protein Tco_0637372 [Tanacetum coccineum]